MSGFLADTNVPSELTKPNPDPRVLEFLRGRREEMFISVLTIGEIRKGIASLPAGKRRDSLQDWINTAMRPWFGERVLPVTEAVANRWSLLATEARSRGIGLSVIDGLIAATALEHNLVLVTRNVGDFAVTGQALHNPWDR